MKIYICYIIIFIWYQVIDALSQKNEHAALCMLTHPVIYVGQYEKSSKNISLKTQLPKLV